MDSYKNVGCVYMNWHKFKKELTANLLSKKVNKLEKQVQEKYLSRTQQKEQKEKQLELHINNLYQADQVVLPKALIEDPYDRIEKIKKFRDTFLDKAWEDYLSIQSLYD